jgi:hypothetical protein
VSIRLKYRILAIAVCLLTAACSSTPAATGPPVSNPPTVTAASTPAASAAPSDSPPPSPQPIVPKPDVAVAAYEGPVEHIFFHPLIVFPELAFDGDSMAQGYDDWFVTAAEFRQMLQLLYDRDYLLIDIHSLYRTETKNGRIEAVPQTLHLPEGKKPLILSVDDLNYYAYMRENGNAWRLVADTDGSVTAWAQTPGGEQRTSREWELVPILDDFVDLHPDFSWQGAKGILALTGYEGILGYRTNDIGGANYEKEKAGALDMVERLKKDGWTFASHSWGHLDVQKSSMSRLKRDTARWLTEVGSLVGPTDVFVYPYGSSVKADDPKLAFLREQGFHVVCSVGPSPFLSFLDGMLLMDRRHIDGMALRTQRQRLEPLFGEADLLDPARPGTH